MEVWQITYLSNSIHSCLVLFRDPTNLLFSCLCQRKHPIPFCEPRDKVLRKKTSFPVFPTTLLAPENFDVPLIENRILLEDLLLPLIGSPGPRSKFWLGSTPQRLTYKKLNEILLKLCVWAGDSIKLHLFSQQKLNTSIRLTLTQEL